MNDFCGVAPATDPYRPAFVEGDISRQWRAEISETESCLPGFGLKLFAHRNCRLSRIRRARAKFPHTKGVRTMQIKDFRRTRVVFAHHARDAGEREFQFVGIGHCGKKQPALRRPRPIRNGAHPDFPYRSVGWLILQTQTEE